jgi:hypothetical protein
VLEGEYKVTTATMDPVAEKSVDVDESEGKKEGWLTRVKLFVFGDKKQVYFTFYTTASMC